MQKDWHTVDTAPLLGRSAFSRCRKRQHYPRPILDRALDVENAMRNREETGGRIAGINRGCVEAIERFEAALKAETTSIVPDQREDVLPSTTVMVIVAVVDTLVNG